MSNLRNILRVTVLGSSNKDGVPFEPSKDIPSLAGQVVVVTGGVGGIGTATVTALARYGRPARLYIADLPPKDEAAKTALLEGLKRGISEEKKEAAAADADAAASPEDETELHFLDLNLSSFESVRACAAAFAEREERLDLLVCNAGILKGAYSMTQEGYESHFGINYLGHALLARLLLPKMVRTVDEHPGGLGRVVFVSSEGHIMIPKGGIAFDKLKTDCKGMVSSLITILSSRLQLGVVAVQHQSNLGMLTWFPLVVPDTIRTEQAGADPPCQTTGTRVPQDSHHGHSPRTGRDRNSRRVKLGEHRAQVPQGRGSALVHQPRARRKESAVGGDKP